MFGKRMAAIREHRNITRKELAATMKVSHTTISRYERELVKPDEEQLKAIARALHCTVAELNDSIHAPLPLAKFRGLAGIPLHHFNGED